MNSIKRPTLFINKSIAVANIKKMVKKAKDNNLSFEPHFKTHQSKEVGKWFREEGVKAITVSSVSMAQYFASHNWQSITIAFPVNVLELDVINELASTINLTLLVQEVETVKKLASIPHKVHINVEIDAGYHRSGIDIAATNEIISLIEAINSTKHYFKGFYCHTGDTYNLRKKEDVQLAFNQFKEKLSTLKTDFAQYNPLIAFGDTPSCSSIKEFSGIDSLHPGNFVFYDYTQMLIGSCCIEQVAAYLLCPVVATYKKRQEIVIYGGGVHLSKEGIISDNKKIFGIVGRINTDNKFIPFEDSFVKSLSQEHGIISTTPKIIATINVGDIVAVLPVHSCMTIDCMLDIYTFGGSPISKMSK